jgi:hypothetical protein
MNVARRASKGNMSWKKRAGALLASAGILSGLGVVAAAPSQAWQWSSGVTLTGTTGCWSSGPQQSAVYGELNGQGHWSYGNGMPTRYNIYFSNVPSGGGWAWFTIHCSVGGDHNRWVWVSRPSWGSTLPINL